MRVKRKSDGSIYHKLGNLRIAGPEIEVDAFLEWLQELEKTRRCYIYGYDEINAPGDLRAIDMSIDIFPMEK